MTVGTIEVFKLPASLVTGDYPVFSSPSATLSSYLTTSFSNAKFTKDFQQRIVIAEFDGWQSANMVRLTSGTWVAWYWITDRSAQTGINSAIEYAIEYNPVSSLLTSSSSVTGYWTRTPTNISPWKQQAVMSGSMIRTKLAYLPNTLLSGGSYSNHRVYWVSVTATEMIQSSGNLNRLCTYGWPVSMYVQDNGFFYMPIYSSSSSTVTAGTTPMYPSLESFMSDPTVFGLSSADVIMDISVSPIIPYDFYTYSGDYPIFALKYTDGTVITADTVKSGTIPYGVYLTEGRGYSTYKRRVGSRTLQLTENQAVVGNVTLNDEQGNDVAQIPTQWFEWNSSTSRYELETTAECVVDFGQMTIRIDIGQSQFQIPCWHMPYIGTQWQSYVAYSQAFDRDSLESSISFAHDALNVQTNASVANGVLGAVGKVLSGDIGGAVSGLLGTGIQTATSYRLQDISDSQARYNQDLTERRIQAQPATVYSVAYGLTELKDNDNYFCGFSLYMPAGYTDEIFDAYIERYGYSAEGKATLTIDTGYYQGQILPTTTVSGGEYDRLNETFMRGIHITEV